MMTDFDVYRAARCLDGAFAEAANDTGAWWADCSDESVNPFYDQTTGGLFVEFYYGHPSKLWTPWGTWGILRFLDARLG